MADYSITISFPKTERELYEFANAQGNTSLFIRELLRREMENPQQNQEIEAKIEKIVRDLLKKHENSCIQTQQVQNTSPAESHEVLEEDIDLINRLF